MKTTVTSQYAMRHGRLIAAVDIAILSLQRDERDGKLTSESRQTLDMLRRVKAHDDFVKNGQAEFNDEFQLVSVATGETRQRDVFDPDPNTTRRTPWESW